MENYESAKRVQSKVADLRQKYDQSLKALQNTNIQINRRLDIGEKIIAAQKKQKTQKKIEKGVARLFRPSSGTNLFVVQETLRELQQKRDGLETEMRRHFSEERSLIKSYVFNPPDASGAEEQMYEYAFTKKHPNYYAILLILTTVGVFDKICNKDPEYGISETFWGEALSKTDIIFISSSSGDLDSPRNLLMHKDRIVREIAEIKEAKNIRGFAIVQTKEDYVYLDLICSDSNRGAALLNKIWDYTLEQHKPRLSLKAINNVISYYAKNGFSVGKSCSQASKDMTKKILDFYISVFNRVKEKCGRDKDCIKKEMTEQYIGSGKLRGLLEQLSRYDRGTTFETNWENGFLMSRCQEKEKVGKKRKRTF